MRAARSRPRALRSRRSRRRRCSPTRCCPTRRSRRGRGRSPASCAASSARAKSIDESNADIARDLRLLVRERIVAGDSDAEVLDFVVDRYGEFVLFRPPFSLAATPRSGSPARRCSSSAAASPSPSSAAARRAGARRAPPLSRRGGGAARELTGADAVRDAGPALARARPTDQPRAGRLGERDDRRDTTPLLRRGRDRRSPVVSPNSGPPGLSADRARRRSSSWPARPRSAARPTRRDADRSGAASAPARTSATGSSRTSSTITSTIPALDPAMQTARIYDCPSRRRRGQRMPRRSRRQPRAGLRRGRSPTELRRCPSRLSPDRPDPGRRRHLLAARAGRLAGTERPDRAGDRRAGRVGG